MILCYKYLRQKVDSKFSILFLSNPKNANIYDGSKHAMNYMKPTCLSILLPFTEWNTNKISATRLYFLCTLYGFYANAKRMYVNYMKGTFGVFCGA